jgi:hypothetical protein
VIGRVSRAAEPCDALRRFPPPRGAYHRRDRAATPSPDPPPSPAGPARPPLSQRGECIRRLRREAGADVDVEPYVAGCNDRVVTVAVPRGAGAGVAAAPGAAGDALVAVFETMADAGRGSLGGSSVLSAGFGSGDEDRDAAMAGGSGAGSGAGSGSTPAGGGAATPDRSSDTMLDAPASSAYADDLEARLLVDASQVGFLVGRGGAAIRATMEATGARVTVLPKGELPACAWVSDEVVSVSGGGRAVAAALRALAAQLEVHPPRPASGGRGAAPLLLAHASTNDAAYAPAPAPGPAYPALAGASPALAALLGAAPPGGLETVFRLLVPAPRAGTLIGRGGEHVRRIRAETGARVKVYEADAAAEERLVAIASTEDAASRYCGAQDALVRCAISLTAEDRGDGLHSIRLLAPQASIGAVLGRRGATVMQLRQETGAAVRALAVEAPLAAAAAAAHGGGEPGGDEVLQIDGTMPQCVSALRGVATLLRGWQAKRAAAAHARAALAASALALPSHAHAPVTIGGVVYAPVGPAGAAPPYAAATAAAVAAAAAAPPAPLPGAPVLWRYRLSNAQAGAVIGKGGASIAQVRGVTGARVHLPADQGPDGSRALEVSGPVESCRAAHALVNELLAAEACAPAVPEHQQPAAAFSPSSAPSSLAALDLHSDEDEEAGAGTSGAGLSSFDDVDEAPAAAVPPPLQQLPIASAAR